MDRFVFFICLLLLCFVHAQKGTVETASGAIARLKATVQKLDNDNKSGTTSNVVTIKDALDIYTMPSSETGLNIVDDDEDGKDVFGSYDSTGHYHKIVAFADLTSVPEKLALAEYDAVVDAPTTTERDSTISNLNPALNDAYVALKNKQKQKQSAGAGALLEVGTKTRIQALMTLSARANATATAAASVATEFKPIDQYTFIGEYKKSKLLGEGSFGEVWLFESQDGEPVVVKFPKIRNMIGDSDDSTSFIDREIRRQFTKVVTENADECSNAATLSHTYPNCFLFMNCFKYEAAKGAAPDGSQDEAFIVLESGGPTTLRDAIKGRHISDADVVAILHQLITAVEKLRLLDLTHHDLKPSNIMLRRDVMRNPFVKIIDYGAMFNYNSGKQKGVHTKRYSPPEFLIKRETSEHRYDLWAMGHIGLELYMAVLDAFVKEASSIVSLQHDDRVGEAIAMGDDSTIKASVDLAKADQDKVARLQTSLDALQDEFADNYKTKNDDAVDLVESANLIGEKIVGFTLRVMNADQSMLTETLKPFRQIADVLVAMLDEEPANRALPSHLLTMPLFQNYLPDEYKDESVDYYSTSIDTGSGTNSIDVQAILQSLKERNRDAPGSLSRSEDTLYAGPLHNDADFTSSELDEELPFAIKPTREDTPVRKFEAISSQILN